MDESIVRSLFDEAKAARDRASLNSDEKKEVWRKFHRLAEAEYIPARDYFVKGLNDPDWDWRSQCVSFLGYHYSFSPDDEIINKIREMVLNDPEDMVRLAAAHVLGSRSKWPEPALITALSDDPEECVRQSAFIALIGSAGVPYPVRHLEADRMDAGEFQPMWKEVERVIAAAGLSSLKKLA